MKKSKLVWLPIGDVIPYERNARLNEEAIPHVAASIREFGFRSPIIVDRNHIIICGHTRLRAAQSLGLAEVPVLVADDENLQAANEIIDNLSDPKTVENIENVESALDRLIEKIDTLRDLDDAISNVAAYNSVVEELVNNLHNALQLKAQLDEADVDE